MLINSNQDAIVGVKTTEKLNNVFPLNPDHVCEYITGDFGEVKTVDIYSRKKCALDDSSAYISYTKHCCADDLI